MMTDREEFKKWWKENSTKIVKDYGFGSFSENVVFSAWQARGELDAVRIKELKVEVKRWQENSVALEYSHLDKNKQIAELIAKLDMAKKVLESLVNGDAWVHTENSIDKIALEEIDK